ncbi:MAG TPA: DUF5685 family protein [Blastocatellia bacterium]|nr:DUF5685 family protein [Blastocatellia bacterium]
MKTRMCHLDGEARLRRRLHYCGTCKTIGRMYGQKSRFLLNNDTVFLAELLSGLSGESERTEKWNKAYQSYNCLSAPACEAEIPRPLEIAATATLVLTEFKIKDHISDSGGGAAKLAHRYYLKSFQRASALLQSWSFPFERLRDILLSQKEREEAVANGDYAGSGKQALQFVAEPTATASALFFGYGAMLVGREEVSDLAYRIGFAFGSLVYILDALEDYENDSKQGGFNAVKDSFRLSAAQLDKSSRQMVVGLLWRYEDDVSRGVFELGISDEYARLFATRLRSNLASRLAVRLPVLQERCLCATTHSAPNLRTRIRSAISLAKSLSEDSDGPRGEHSITRTLAAPLLFVSSAAIALLFPGQTREATSYSECFGVLFNLMAITAFARSVLSAPLRFAFPPGAPPPAPPPGPPPQAPAGSEYGELPPSAPPPGGPVRRRRGCSVCCCDSDCCDCGDCCCDSIDCCDCCSGCDC